MGKARHVVHHQHDIHSLVAEIFGNRGRRICSAQTVDRSRIACRDDDDGALHALLAEVSVYEVHDLATAFPDKTDYVYVGIRIPGNHRKERRFSDTRTRENSETLPFSA